MARKRERAESGRGQEIVRRVVQGTPENTVGLRVVGRVAGLPRALLVRKSEQPEPTRVARVLADLLLQPRKQGGVRLSECRSERPGSRPSRGAPVQHAAEQEGGGGQDRRRSCDDKAPRRHYGFCWPFVFS